MSFRKTIQFLATLWFTVVVAIGVSVFVDRYAPTIEGNYFPVVSTASITNIESVSPTLTRVWLRSTKLRDCRYEEIEWWYGERPPGVANRITVVFEEPPQQRDTGDMVLGPWLVALPAETLMSNSFAYVTHNCHVLWDTRSLFFVGGDSTP